MTTRKTTKRALLLSALSLLLCVSMLIGSTFAWFTDSVTSAGNIIKSGKLEVTMEWKDATDAGAQKSWEDASKVAIFNYDKWEPGYVEAKNIKISNIGTLAFQYNLSIAAEEAVGELAKVIDVYYADGEITLINRDMTELTKVGTLQDVLDGMPTNMTGDLKADKSDIVTIALKMQENAGNEYQDMSIGTAFSIILMATQDNIEKDVFDENYDDIEIPNMDVQNINGVTYGIANDGNYYMISVDDPALTQFDVDNAVTILGTGNGENDNDRVFGKNAPLASLTLPEGLVEIKDNALNTLPNLTTVNFPSTLKTIGINGFKMTGMTEVTIHKNVETIKKGAFRDMANLTTVTVEGNVAFDNYAFRSCPNLTCIYLLGDDVTFEGSQFATHDDNGACTSAAHKDNCPGKIIIYVKNATVAARVIAAQGTSSCYEVKILGDNNDGTDAQPVVPVKNNAQLTDAISNAAATGETTIILADGTTYNTDLALTAAAQGNKGDLVFKAAGDNVKFTGTVTLGYRDQGVGAEMFNSNVTFEGVVFDHAEAGKHSLEIGDVKGLSLKDCTIIGDGEYGINSASGNNSPNAKIINCTFQNAGIQVLGQFGNGLVIDGCTFNDSKVNVQSGVHVTIQNCKFNNTLTDAHVGDSFYAIRSNDIPITVKNCQLNIDSTVTGVATAQEKWYLLANRGITDWTVEDVAVTLTDAALAQTELVVTACTKTGVINTTNLTVNGVVQ